MSREYLYVYGTLRKDFGLALMQQIGEDLGYVGLGEIEAALYDLGDYPGATKGLATRKLSGEVFEIRNSEKVLLDLDEYEGEEYKREKVAVRTNEGKELEAWVYWYSGIVDEASRIYEGDYLLYLENKKERLA